MIGKPMPAIVPTLPLNIPTNSFPAPFTAIHVVYKEAFDLYIDAIVSSIEAALASPLLACLTLWVIVQGILVIRGDIDARKGVTKLVMIAIVVGLVSSASIYHDYIYEMFIHGIPNMVSELGGNFGLPAETLPLQLDVIFRTGEAAFQAVAAEIPPTNVGDSLSLEVAQFFFYFTLWSIFGIYDVVGIMTAVLVAVGPLFIIGFLFEATRGIATNWIGILVGYAIMLLLLLIVASVVVSVLVLASVPIIAQLALGTTAQDIIVLHELDFLILTGNALVVAVPAIASQIGGGVTVNGSQMGQSVFRRFARYDRPQPTAAAPSHQVQSLGAFSS
jgi:type IV secretion system protein VirB6